MRQSNAKKSLKYFQSRKAFYFFQKEDIRIVK